MKRMTIETINEGIKKGGFLLKVDNRNQLNKVNKTVNNEEALKVEVREGVNVEATLKINLELKELCRQGNNTVRLNKIRKIKATKTVEVKVEEVEEILPPPNMKISH